MIWSALTWMSVNLQIDGGMTFSRYARTALASPFIASTSLCVMHCDVLKVFPPTVVVPTHWPALIRSAAAAGRARHANANVAIRGIVRLVFMGCFSFLVVT